MGQAKQGVDIRGYLGGIIGLLLFGGLVFSITNYQVLNDYWYAYKFRDNQTISRMSETLRLTDRGDFLLRASRAEINDQQAFNKNCSGLVEQTVVLGCFTDDRIYVYNVDNKRLNGIREVTMAHEMLHAAYERLDREKKAEVNQLVTAQYATITDDKFRETVELYRKTEPGQELNELHSMLATEIRTLSPELETYYSNFFEDRLAVVALSESYESVFRELDQKQQALVDEMNTLADSVDKQKADYDHLADSLERAIDRFNSDVSDDKIRTESEYNSRRSSLLSRQASLETLRIDINTKIDRYQAVKNELDALNIQAGELQKSIDSLPNRVETAL